jgi:heat shock protein HspQ
MAYEMTLRSLEGISGALDRLSSIDLQRKSLAAEHSLAMTKLGLQQQDTEAQNRLSLLNAQDTVKERTAARESRKVQEGLAQSANKRAEEQLGMARNAEQRDIERNTMIPFSVRYKNALDRTQMTEQEKQEDMTKMRTSMGDKIWIKPTTANGMETLMLRADEWAHQEALYELRASKPGAAAKAEFGQVKYITDDLTKAGVPLTPQIQDIIDRTERQNPGIKINVIKTTSIDPTTKDSIEKTSYVPEYVNSETATAQLYQKKDEQLRKTRPFYATLKEGDPRKYSALQDAIDLDDTLSDPSKDEQTKNDLRDAYDEKHFHERYQDENGNIIDRGIRTPQGVKPAKGLGAPPISTPLKPGGASGNIPSPTTQWIPPQGTGSMSLGQAATILPPAIVGAIGSGVVAGAKGVKRGVDWYTKPTGEFDIQTPTLTPKPIVPEPKPKKVSSLDHNQEVISAFNNMMSYLGNSRQG